MNFDWISGPHAPFILTAYGISLAVLAYTALAPLLNGRRQRRQLAAAQQHADLPMHTDPN